MQSIIAFLDGIITFISPCLLPMLPIYISYFAGGGERKTGKTLSSALGFVAGFTLVFISLGALAGTVGSFLREYQKWLHGDLSFVMITINRLMNLLTYFIWMPTTRLNILTPATVLITPFMPVRFMTTRMSMTTCMSMTT